MAKLDYALLCDAALTHPDGKVSMLGAGIDHLWGEELPIRTLLTLVFRIVWDDSELGEPSVISIRVERDGGQELAVMHGPVFPQRGPGAIHLLPVATIGHLPLPLELAEEGRYFVRFELGTHELGRLPFVAVVKTPGP